MSEMDKKWFLNSVRDIMSNLYLSIQCSILAFL